MRKDAALRSRTAERWSARGSCGKRASQEPRGDREVEQVPADAVQERGAVGAGRIEYRSGHPAAERHAEERRHEDDGDARARFARREVFADDERIRGHESALEEAEERRDDVERREAVERHEERERDALQDGAKEQRAQAADAIGDPARGEAADDAEAEHEREHLGAALRAVTEDRKSTRLNSSHPSI